MLRRGLYHLKSLKHRVRLCCTRNLCASAVAADARKLVRFEKWCETQNIFSPKINFTYTNGDTPLVNSVYDDILAEQNSHIDNEHWLEHANAGKLDLSTKTVVELKAMLRAMKLSASGSKSLLIERIRQANNLELREPASIVDCKGTGTEHTQQMINVDDMTTYDLRDELRSMGASTSGKKRELVQRLKEYRARQKYCEKEAKLEQLLDEAASAQRGPLYRLALFAATDLESDGIYGAIPKRLIICRDSALNDIIGVKLRLVWPKIPTNDELHTQSRKQVLQGQYEEICCLAVFLLAHLRKEQSMWRSWLDLLPPCPQGDQMSLRQPFNVVYFDDTHSQVLAGSHISQEIDFVRMWISEWYQLYVEGEKTIEKEAGGAISWKEFQWAVSLILSRSQLLPKDLFDNSQFGVIPLSDFMDHRPEHSEDDIIGEEKRSFTAATSENLSGTTSVSSESSKGFANMCVSYCDDSVEVKQSMRRAFGLPAEDPNEREETLFLQATRPVGRDQQLFFNYFSYGGSDNAQLLLTHGFMEGLSNTVIKLPIYPDHDAMELNVHNNQVDVEDFGDEMEKIMHDAAPFLDAPFEVDDASVESEDPVVWTLPYGAKGRMLLRECLLPYVRLQVRGMDTTVAIEKLRKLLLAKLDTYGPEEAEAVIVEEVADNPTRLMHGCSKIDDRSQAVRDGLIQLIAWEREVVRQYLEDLDGIARQASEADD